MFNLKLGDFLFLKPSVCCRCWKSYSLVFSVLRWERRKTVKVVYMYWRVFSQIISFVKACKEDLCCENWQCCFCLMQLLLLCFQLIVTTLCFAFWSTGAVCFGSRRRQRSSFTWNSLHFRHTWCALRPSSLKLWDNFFVAFCESVL